MDKCRESPPTDWPAAAYILLGREDLALSRFSHSSKSKESEPQNNVNLVSMSTPYMLHLHPVTIPSSISDTFGLEDTKFEDADFVDGSTADGMEHIFNSTTQLRFGRDLRLNEVSCAGQTNSTCKIPDKDLGKSTVSCCFYFVLIQTEVALPCDSYIFYFFLLFLVLWKENHAYLYLIWSLMYVHFGESYTI